MPKNLVRCRGCSYLVIGRDEDGLREYECEALNGQCPDEEYDEDADRDERNEIKREGDMDEE